MFANPTKVGISQRVVATLVVCAMVLWSIGVSATAEAAQLNDISNTLSDSDPLVSSSHTIAFTIPTGSTLTNTDTISVTFDSQDDGDPGQSFSDIASVAGVTVTVGGGPDTATGFVSTADGFTFAGIDATAGQEVIIVVADGTIINPTTTASYEIEVDTGNGDVGRTRVAIVDNVVVTAIVDTSFEFTISGLATSTVVNTATTTGSSTPQLLDFGTLTAGTPSALAQRLNVTTNARNGYVVTVESDGDLQSGNGAIIDNFVDGGDQALPGQTWVSPANTLLDETTWGHWGFTINDSDIGSLEGVIYGGVDFGANEFVAASTTPRQVMHHNDPSDGTTQDVGQADVLYQIEITPLQEAADDYTTTLTYIATPTF